MSEYLTPAPAKEHRVPEHTEPWTTNTPLKPWAPDPWKIQQCVLYTLGHFCPPPEGVSVKCPVHGEHFVHNRPVVC